MRRRLTLIMISVLLAISLCEVAAGPNVSYSKRWVSGVPAHVVTANLNSPDVRVSAALSKHGVGTSEGFGSMLSRLQPTAAITGTYFCTRSLVPVGHIVVDGKLVSPGSVGTGICFTPDNKVEFKPTSLLREERWMTYSSLVCAGPRLVRAGTPSVSMRGEGFRDRRLWHKNVRSAIGVTKWNRLLLVTVNRPIYLSTLAKVMKDLGAVDAINLDGGGSTALYWSGRAFSHPSRRLTNLIVIYDSPTMFARIKPQLAPTPTIAAGGTKAQAPPAPVIVPTVELARTLNTPTAVPFFGGDEPGPMVLEPTDVEATIPEPDLGQEYDLSVLLPTALTYTKDFTKGRKRGHWRLGEPYLSLGV